MKRKIFIKVYSSEADNRAIKDLAAALRIPVSKLCRDAVLGIKLSGPPPMVPQVNRQTYLELSRIGNNLNQIALAMNQKLPVPGTDVNSALAGLVQALKTVRSQVVGQSQ